MQTAVCYLSRAGNPDYLSWNFFASLLESDTGQIPELWIILKGYEVGQTDPVLGRLPSRLLDRVRVLRVDDSGYDINAYFTAARRLDKPHFLFFNSYSRLLDAGWFSHYVGAFRSLGGDGLVGATGSFERMRQEDPWPNIHVRSNGFMIGRDRFLGLDTGPLKSKRDCNHFEAGHKSMTRQILDKGGQVALVDRRGRVVKPQDWPTAVLFRSGRQENLLVSDNRCHAWDMARNSKRKKLAVLAFGEEARPADISPLDRGRAWYRWNRGRLSFFPGKRGERFD